VVGDDVQRHSVETEAAIYFCCLEAMQNAGKHAGEDSRLTVTVTESDGELRFEVADDGAGFDVAAAAEGHGFVNMRDRLGAIGGTLEVHSAPGEGTQVRGRIPVGAEAPDPEVAPAPA
jgi:signal transduction histidine kinase